MSDIKNFFAGQNSKHVQGWQPIAYLEPSENKSFLFLMNPKFIKRKRREERKMENMTEEEEWLASILRETTKLHHRKGLAYFKEFMKKKPKAIIGLRKREGKRFSTRVILFWKWLQEEKKLSANTSSSYVIAVRSFFSYFDLDLKLKGKIPDTKMRIERYTPTLEDLQKIYRLGDIQTKAVLSLMRDCPARIGDLVKRVIPRIKKKEFLIESEKETVVGKVYVSMETLQLFKQLEEAGVSLPKTKRGVGKLLEKACRIANLRNSILI